MEKKIDYLSEGESTEEFELLKSKVKEMEEFLIRRTRGFYLRDKNR
ncbi:hypothetical protein [Clostridium sp. Cult3]|nr:hypothetical protein [Clostridium sp. Cult3]